MNTERLPKSVNSRGEISRCTSNKEILKTLHCIALLFPCTLLGALLNNFFRNNVYTANNGSVMEGL